MKYFFLDLYQIQEYNFVLKLLFLSKNDLVQILYCRLKCLAILNNDLGIIKTIT